MCVCVAVCSPWDLWNGTLYCRTSFTSVKSFAWWVSQTAWWVPYFNAKCWTHHFPSLWFHISTLTVCVHVCVVPARSLELNIIWPHFFHQHKELCLACSSNCLTTLLLQCIVANTPFATPGLNAPHKKPGPPLAIQDILLLVCSLHPFIVTHDILTQETNVISRS